MLFVRVCRVPGFHPWFWELRLISSTCFSNLRKFNPKAVVWVRVLEPNSRTALLVLFLLLGPRHTKISLRVSCARAPAEFPCQRLDRAVYSSTHDPSKIFSHRSSVCSFDLSFSTALAACCEEARTSRWLLFGPEELRFGQRRLSVSSSHIAIQSNTQAAPLDKANKRYKASH